MEEARKKRTRHEIPKGAVTMTKQDAISYQAETILNWKPRSDVWSFIYGRPILLAATAFSGAYINYRFRRKLKLLNYGQIPTMLGASIVPMLTINIGYKQLIENKLLLLEVDCPLCLQSTSALLQTLTGLFFPLLITPIANFAVVGGSGTFNVPYITDIRGIFHITRSAYQPLIGSITIIFTLHALLAGFITQWQIKSYLHMQEIQHLLEEDLKRSLQEKSICNLHDP